MNKAPDGAVVGEVSSDDDRTITPTGEPEREAGEHGDPNPMGGAGAVSGAGARPRRNRTPECPRRNRTPERHRRDRTPENPKRYK